MRIFSKITLFHSEWVQWKSTTTTSWSQERCCHSQEDLQSLLNGYWSYYMTVTFRAHKNQNENLFMHTPHFPIYPQLKNSKKMLPTAGNNINVSFAVATEQFFRLTPDDMEQLFPGWKRDTRDWTWCHQDDHKDVYDLECTVCFPYLQ